MRRLCGLPDPGNHHKPARVNFKLDKRLFDYPQDSEITASRAPRNVHVAYIVFFWIHLSAPFAKISRKPETSSSTEKGIPLYFSILFSISMPVESFINFPNWDVALFSTITLFFARVMYPAPSGWSGCTCVK